MSTHSLIPIYTYRGDLAMRYGDREAVLLEYFIQRIGMNRKDEEFIAEKKVWVRISWREIQEAFPHWSVQRVRTVLGSLLQQKLLTRKNLNHNAHNRVYWYAFINERRFLKKKFIAAEPHLVVQTN